MKYCINPIIEIVDHIYVLNLTSVCHKCLCTKDIIIIFMGQKMSSLHLIYVCANPVY